MNNDLLPIGTVIKTYNNDSLYLILGTFFKKDNKIYTYYCCKYPAGLIMDAGHINNKINKYEIYINQNDIENIVFLGNVNSEV